MTAIFHKPLYRLSKLLRKPGGKTVEQAVIDALAELQRLAPECLAAVDKDLIELNALAASLDEPPTRDQLMGLYEVARRLVGPATVAGLPAMERAAFSLCDLADGMAASGRAAGNPIQVHIHAVNLLRQQHGMLSEEEAAQVVAGLAKVSRKFAAPDEGEAAAGG